MLTRLLLRTYGAVTLYFFGIYAYLKQIYILVVSSPKKLDFGSQEDKVFIVTGGLFGIGRQVVEELLRLGAFVILTGRNPGRKISESLEQLSNLSTRFQYVQVELESMKNVAKFCEQVKKDYKHLDGIVCNAGCLRASSDQLTSENFEPQQAVNYFSNVLMVENLKPLLYRKNGQNSRVVLVTSIVHNIGYCNLDDIMLRKSNCSNLGYVQSKLCQVAYACHRSANFLEEGISINSVHPGVVATSLYSGLLKFLGTFFFMSTKRGAETVLYTLLSRTMEGVSGQYLEYCEVVKPVKKVQDVKFQKRLYDLTVKNLRPWLVMKGERTTDDYLKENQ